MMVVLATYIDRNYKNKIIFKKQKRLKEGSSFFSCV
jgi:hypothetical protein